MAANKSKSGFRIGQLILAGYVGICVVLVILALIVAFDDLNSGEMGQQAAPIEPISTPTISPIVLTLEAQEAAQTAPDNSAP